MLELRPNCECCDKDLPPESREAMICTFECTFCADCVEGVLEGRVPELRRRIHPPSRASGRDARQESGFDEACPEGRGLRAPKGGMRRTT